ncbi:hypothetical protein CAEBREN_31189 [Caenorhabditis brenneri]|uniref:Tyrosine-protein phosphatase domain-containing protein n=1 Tax=Caenorhabditis brenneri TaxID=135651 RepID=G0NSD2_CAEBE|nr:hypothetical protein CAEBREN_31189 [Caenorhabditis brenneri]
MLLKLICFVICMLHLSLEDTAKMARMSRATETKLSILIEHFQSLSRISNGISLKIGLLDGSFPPDDVIVELLHLGKLKLQDILDLQKSDTDRALNQFDTLPKTLETTPEVINIENRLLLLVDTRNYRMENYQNFTGRPDYEQHLKEVTKLKDIHAKVSSLIGDASIWRGFISKLNDRSKGMDDPTAVDAFGEFSIILKYLVAIENLPKNFKTCTDQLKTAKLIKQKSRFIDQLENESVSRSKLDVSTKYTDEGLNTIKTELKNTLDASKIVNKARSAFQTISQLIRPQPFFYKYSSGFPRGGEDLAKLSKDVSDEWILKHASNGTLVTENLNDLFVKMDELETQFEKVKTSWDPVKEKSIQVESVISLLLKLTEIEHVDLNTITNTSHLLKKCDKENSAYTNVDFASLKPVLDDMDKLNKKLDGISDFDYVSQFEDLSLLKKALELREPPPATDAEKAKVAREIVKNVVSAPNFSKILILLKDFHKDLEAFETAITESSTLASQIKFTEIDDYHNTTKGYMKIYECIGKVGENGEQLRNLIRSIEEIRPLKLPSGNVSPMINLILDSHDNLSKLQDYLKNMKNPEASNSLKESFPNFEEVSRNLGVAVQGLVAVKEASDAKSELQSLLNMALDPKNLDNVQELKALAELFKGIDSFLSFLDGVDGLRRKRQTADFKNDQQVFVEAQKISSWKVDMEKFRSEIEAITGNHKVALDKLETLDLDFSKFKFSQAVSSLTALDDLFTLFSTKLNLQPLVALPNVDMQPPDDSHMDLQVIIEPGEMAESPLAWVGDYAVVKISGCLLLIVFFVVFLVIGLIFLFCPQCWGFCGVVDNGDPENPVENRQTKHPETSKLTVTPINEEKVEHAEPEIKDKGKTKQVTSKGTENRNSTEEKSKELVPGKGKPEEKVTIKKVTEKPNHENNSNNDPNTKNKNKNDPNTKKKNKYDPNSKNKNSKQGAGKNDEKKVKTVNGPKKRSNDPSAKHSSSRESADREKKKLNAVVLRRDAVLDEEGKKSLFYFMDYILNGIDTNISKQRKYPNEILMDIFASINKSENRFDSYLDYAENQSERIERARICLESSMVVLKGFESTDGYRKTNYYNGSVYIEGRKKWIVAQDPMDGTEVETYGENDISIKANTIEKHLGAIHQHDVERVIRFTPFEREGEKVCARWHREDVDIDGTNLMRFGRYSVQTVGKESEVERFNNPDMFTKYLLKITDLVTKISKSVVVIFYNWNNPKDPKDGQDILNYLEESKGNVMLQDRNGLGASCVIMAIKFTIVKHEFVHNIEQMIRFVSDWRRGAIRNAGDVFYMILCIIESLMEFNKVEFTMVYHSFDYYYDKFLEGEFDRRNPRRINLFERNGLPGSREEYVEQKFKEYEEKKAAESKKTNKTLKKAKNVDTGDVNVENQSNQQNVVEIKKEQSLKNLPEKSATGQKSSKSTKLVAQKSSKSNKNLDGSKKKVT